MKLHDTQPNSVGKLLATAATELQGLDSARLDAEILLCMVLNLSREYCYAHPETQVSAAAAADFWRLITRCRDGFPVAYLTGQREFWSLDITVNQFTLVPRPETEDRKSTRLNSSH